MNSANSAAAVDTAFANSIPLPAAPVRKRVPWTADLDAILMEGVAEGRTFAAIGRRMGKTKNACVGRFQTLRAQMGWQAA